MSSSFNKIKRLGLYLGQFFVIMGIVYILANTHQPVINTQASEIAIQDCMTQEDDTTPVWTLGAWENRFGERQSAVAQTRLVPELEFGFHHFTSRRDADPLVLLIGHSAVMSQWDPLILSQLKKCFDVYLIDNYGIGRSKLSHNEETEKELLDQLEWKDLGDFISQAVEGMKNSQHCKENQCNINNKPPHLLGWAMGGKVAAEASALKTHGFSKFINLGGNIAHHQGSTGPNPAVVETLEASPYRQAQNAFYVNADSWGYDKAINAKLAVAGTSARAAIPFFAWSNRQGRASHSQKMAQARVSLTSNTQLSAIENPVLMTWGKQDDLNFCYPSYGSRFQEVCVHGKVCSDGIDCNTPQARPTCEGWSWSASKMLSKESTLGFKSLQGCYWGIAPVDDYYWGRKHLTSAQNVCAKGFQGAHGFPAQSRDEMVKATVDFVYGLDDQDIYMALDCHSKDSETSRSLSIN